LLRDQNLQITLVRIEETERSIEVTTY
jgi:hypothetical protein